MTTPRVTLLDVAQRAGVSRTTASFVMTGRRDMRISSDAEQRVLQAARELNYRPSLLARSLRTNLSQTIGLISDVIATEVFAGEVIRGSMATALLHDHLMFIGETEGDPEVEKRLVQSMLDRGVGGFVYASMYTRNVRVSKTLRDQPIGAAELAGPGQAAAVGDSRRAGSRPVRGPRTAPARPPRPDRGGRRTGAACDRRRRTTGRRRGGAAPTRHRTRRFDRHPLVAGVRPSGGPRPTWSRDTDRQPSSASTTASRWAPTRPRMTSDLPCPQDLLGGVVRRFRSGRLAAAAADQRGDSTFRDGPTSGRTTAHAGSTDRRPTRADAAARPGVGWSAAGAQAPP